MDIIDLLPAGSWSPALPDAAEEIAALERRVGRPIPADLRQMFLRCGRVSLLDETYTFLTPAQIAPLAKVQFDDDTEDYCPRTWLGVIDLQDGNYVGLDIVPNEDGTYNWLDCCHETVGEVDVIASSLEEFLAEALSHPDGQYWLASGHKPYRHIVYENPPSYWRRLHGDWYRTLADETGPGRCTAPDCVRPHILHSVKCRRHHYEMVQKRPSPFDEE